MTRAHVPVCGRAFPNCRGRQASLERGQFGRPCARDMHAECECGRQANNDRSKRRQHQHSPVAAAKVATMHFLIAIAMMMMIHLRPHLGFLGL